MYASKTSYFERLTCFNCAQDGDKCKIELPWSIKTVSISIETYTFKCSSPMYRFPKEKEYIAYDASIII